MTTIAGLAVHRLRTFPYPLDIGAAIAGAATTAPETVPAALRTWLVFGFAITGIAYWIKRRRPDWGVGESAAGAVILWWSVGYVSLLALGPFGLYRVSVLRALVIALLSFAIILARRGQPRMTVANAIDPGSSDPSHGYRVAGDAGWWLLVLVIVLMAGPLLLLQIGSPVSPFMDVLGYIAPIQKIVTFQFFDPYANDAAGLWSPTRQVVGFDALFAFVALVVGLPAHLAMSSLIVPFAVLQLGALYLLARVTNGRVAGAMGALFLLQTFLWRRTPDLRSTGLAFPLIAIGLAFLLHARRDGRRAAMGGLALGLSVTVSPLIGALGMQVATVAALVEWLDGGRRLRTPVLALAGGSLFALPQVFTGLAVSAPPAVLVSSACAGIALLAMVGRLGIDPPRTRGRLRPVALAFVASLPVGMLFLHAHRTSEMFNDNWFGYPVLLMFAVAGLVAVILELYLRTGSPAVAVPALALWLGIVNHDIADPLRFVGTLETRSLASEVTTKMMYYWLPYWLALETGVLFATVARRWSLVGSVIVALLVVIYPVHLVVEPLDYDSQQLSLAETWGFHLANAARGYHSGRPDRRWVLDANWRELASTLVRERVAGRIDYYTHVLMITPSIDSVELALWTGISVDLITPQYDPQSIWTGNGRARGMDSLPAAFAARPPYVLVQGYPLEQFPQLDNYDLMRASPLVSLYRLRE